MRPVTAPPRPVQPLVALGVVALAAGLVAWAWIGTWQWAVTGAATLLICAVAAASRNAT